MKQSNASIRFFVVLTGLALVMALPGCYVGYGGGPEWDDGIFVGGGYDYYHRDNAFHYGDRRHSFGAVSVRGRASIGGHAGGGGGGHAGGGGGHAGGGGGGHR